jgi:hypothetical protein
MVYGSMEKSNSPSASKFYGNYILKTDNSGNELYRILFNDNLKGYVTNGPFFSALGEDQYLYLFGFYDSLTQVESFCISEVEVNHMVTSLKD